MNTRKKLALIFGTPIAIALILVTVYYSKVQEKIDPIITPPPAPSDKVLSDETKEPAIPEGWSVYKDPTEGFLINLPPGSQASSFDDGLIITSDPIDTPVPSMKITIEEAHDDEYEDLRNMHTLSNIEINGIKGRLRVDKYEADEIYPESLCETYRLEHNNKFYSFFTWECLDWEPFEDVVKSFRFQ